MSKELGQQFIDEILGKLPEGQRAEAQKILTSPDAAAALEHAGSRLQLVNEAATRKTALDQQQTKLEDWHKRLDGWAQVKETEFTAREKKLAEGHPNPNPNPNAPPTNTPATGTSLTAEQIAQTVAETLAAREPAYVGLLTEATGLASFHLRNFKEDLDVQQLVSHADAPKIGVKGVYKLLYKDRLDKLDADAKKAAEDTIRSDERSTSSACPPISAPRATRRQPRGCITS
jgi:hypothetical protein